MVGMETMKFRAVALAFLLCWVGGESEAAPRAEIWPRWKKHDPTSAQRIDHSLWDQFLKKYLVAPHPSGFNRVRYAVVTPEDRSPLKSYNGRLEQDYDWRLNSPEPTIAP
jgi:hypothetical protein